MPYPTLESLPDGVKALPKEAQEIWRNAANSALGKYPGDDEKAAKIGWGAVKNGGWVKDAEGNWTKIASMTREQDYSIWTSMKSRCSNNNDKDYARYGGRGISVCQRWKDSFEDFMKDMGTRQDGYTIERINNNGNYEPKNCQWADRTSQAQNRTHAKTHEFDVECFSVGTWNGDKYNDDDLNEMIHAFYELRESVKPPVKLAHDNKAHLTDGQPALGWVKGLKKVGDKLIATVTQVPDILYKAIASGRYKRVSAEIYWNLKEGGKTFKRVLSAVGLLGTDIPAVSNLADLEAFLSQTPGSGTFEKMATYAFDVNESGKINIEKGKVNIMDEKEIKRLTDELNEAKTNLEKATTENKTYKAEAEALKKEKTENLKKARSEEIKTFCEQMVKDGKMTPAARDILIKDLDKHVYTDDAGFSITFDAFKKCIETHAKVFDVTEKGREQAANETKTYKNVAEELTAKVRKYMAEHKDINYTNATRAVFEADPDLAKRYRDD